MSFHDVEHQARFLARENRRGEPRISKVYWFPHDSEVRLVELDPAMPPSGDGEVHPFFFRPAPKDNLPAPSGVALINPQEFGRLVLPAGWGRWEDARELEDTQ